MFQKKKNVIGPHRMREENPAALEEGGKGPRCRCLHQEILFNYRSKQTQQFCGSEDKGTGQLARGNEITTLEPKAAARESSALARRENHFAVGKTSAASSGVDEQITENLYSQEEPRPQEYPEAKDKIAGFAPRRGSSEKIYGKEEESSIGLQTTSAFGKARDTTLRNRKEKKTRTGGGQNTGVKPLYEH